MDLVVILLLVMSFLFAVAFGALAIVGAYKAWTWYGSNEISSQEKTPILGSEPSLDCTRQGLKDDILKTWRRPVGEIAVAVDLPRLANKTTIFEGNNVVLDGATFTKQPLPHALVHELLLTLCQLTDFPRTAIDDHFAPVMNPTGEMSNRLQYFLTNHFSHGPVVNILKACNQSLIAAAVIRLKLKFGKYYPYKDQRGQWTIENRILADRVVIAHRKWETSWEANERAASEHFDFEWQLTLTFDRSVSELCDVDFRVTRLVFADGVGKAFRELVRERLAIECVSEVPVE